MLILQNMKSALDFAQSPAVRALVEGHSKWTLIERCAYPASRRYGARFLCVCVFTVAKATEL
jgi:hypothetical protein